MGFNSGFKGLITRKAAGVNCSVVIVVNSSVARGDTFSDGCEQEQEEVALDSRLAKRVISACMCFMLKWTGN